MTRMTCDFCGKGMQPRYDKSWKIDVTNPRGGKGYERIADFCSLKCVAGWAITNIPDQDIDLYDDATAEQEEALKVALDALKAVEV